MIEGGEDLRLSPESSQSVRVRRERIREHLQGIVSLERRVMRSPNLTHAAFANQGGDFIGAEPSPGSDHRRETSGHPREGHKTELSWETGVIIAVQT
jgi:hypothetical protein